MSKFLKLTVVREQAAEITVEVPDDFDEMQLVWKRYEKAIAAAVKAQDPWWDEHDVGYTVNEVDPQTEADARQYVVTDIIAALKACDDEMKAQQEAFLAPKTEQAKKASES